MTWIVKFLSNEAICDLARFFIRNQCHKNYEICCDELIKRNYYDQEV